jgi:hypothetical protein
MLRAAFRAERVAPRARGYLRRGRGKTACARGAYRALLGGPSTSPLEGLLWSVPFCP